MSNDNLDQEHKSVPVHELSETPFGGSSGATEQVAEVSEPEVQQAEVSSEVPEPVAEEALVEIEEPMTMEAAMAASDAEFSGSKKGLSVGDVVYGTVVHIDKESVLVDVGTKSEGVIRPGELSRDPSLDPEQVVSVGEKIKVYVIEPEGRDGGPVLSKKRADFENAWDRLQKAHREGEVLKAMVSDRVKGGLVIDLGIRGFVPASHVGSGKLKNLDKFVGQSMLVKVIEVDRERRKVVLSNRFAVEEEQQELRKQTVGSLKEGQIRDGVVRRVTDYGAFVDLGGVDGLLHISEMSWTRINHPSEVVKVGQKLQVMVLKMNLEQGRVSLGLRQILPDPWEDVKRIHSTGDVVKGMVTRLVPFGAFVQVEGGVEGIVPNSELAYSRINGPEDVVSAGQEIEVKIIDLRPDERRLTLSLKQLQAPPERVREDTGYKSYAQERPDSRTTIGDLIGQQLNGMSFEAPEAEKPAKKKSTRTKAAMKASIEEAEAIAEAEEALAQGVPAVEDTVDEVEVAESAADVQEAPAEETAVAEAAEAIVEEVAEVTEEEAKTEEVEASVEPATEENATVEDVEAKDK